MLGLGERTLCADGCLGYTAGWEARVCAQTSAVLPPRHTASYPVVTGLSLCCPCLCPLSFIRKVNENKLSARKSTQQSSHQCCISFFLLLVISTSSSRERLLVAEPASVGIRLLARWLSIMAGRGGCLRWREASVSYLVSRQGWKPSFLKNNFKKWVFWLHLPQPHPRQQLWVVSATLYCCFERLRSVRSPAWRAGAQRPPVSLKNSEQMCLGNERWSEFGVSAQCKARAACTGTKYTLSSMRKV